MQIVFLKLHSKAMLLCQTSFLWMSLCIFVCVWIVCFLFAYIHIQQKQTAIHAFSIIWFIAVKPTKLNKVTLFVCVCVCVCVFFFSLIFVCFNLFAVCAVQSRQVWQICWQFNKWGKLKTQHTWRPTKIIAWGCIKYFNHCHFIDIQSNGGESDWCDNQKSQPNVIPLNLYTHS